MHYTFSNLEISIKISLESDQYKISGGYIKSELKVENTDIVLSVIIHNQNEEWQLRIFPELTEPIKLTFDQLKLLLNEKKLEDEIPEIFLPLDQIELSKLELCFNNNFSGVNSKLFNLNIGDFTVLETLLFEIKDAKLICDIKTSFAEEVTYISVEGPLYANTLALPQVKVSLSSEDYTKLKIQMLDEEYLIGRLSELKPLLNDLNLEEYLPAGMTNFSGVSLTSFDCEVDKDLGELNLLSFTIKTPSDDINGWNIIPDKLYMKNVLMEVSFPFLSLVFKGTVGVGNTELPMKVELDISDANMPTKLFLQIDKGYGVTDWSMPISLDDLSIANFELSSLLPGLNSLELSIDKFGVGLLIDNSLNLDQFEFGLKSDKMWNIIPGIKLGDFYLDFNYLMNSTQGDGSYEVILDSILKINIQDADPIPIKLSALQGDWELEFAGEDEQGVAIPGLQGLSELVKLDLSNKLPDSLSFEGVHLVDLLIRFPHPSEQKLTSLYTELTIPDEWKFTDKLKLNNLHFQMDVDYTSENTPVEFMINGDLDINGIQFEATVQKTIDQWIFTIEDSEVQLSLNDFKDIIPLASKIELPEFINNITDVSIKLNKLEMAYNESMDQLVEFSYNIELDKPWIVAQNVIELKELKVEYRKYNLDQAESSSEGSVYSNLMLAGIEIPTIVPLPFNSGNWTLQLAEPIQVPSYDLINEYSAFAIEPILEKLPGFSIPELYLSKCNLKFDLDPFEMQAIELSLDFADSLQTTLPPGLNLNLQSVAVCRDYKADTSQTVVNGTIGAGSLFENIPLTLELTPTQNRLTVSAGEDGKPLKASLGSAINLIPGVTCPKPMQNCSTEVTEMQATYDQDMQLQEYSAEMKANGIGDAINTTIVNDEVKFKAEYDEEGKPGLQLLEWPFKISNIKSLKEDGWVLLDFESAGAVKLKLPKIQTNGSSLVFGGGIDICSDGETVEFEDGSTKKVNELNIPLKTIFDKVGLSFLNSVFPDQVPLTPKLSLGEIIRSLKGDPNNLPETFKPYLDIKIPDRVEFEFIITESGEVRINVNLKDLTNIDEPIKLLIPAGVFIIGIQLERLAFTFIKGILTMDLDAEVDFFMLPLLVALSWFNVKKIPPLPDFDKVHVKLKAKDLFAVFSPVGIPMPIFYDELSLRYVGIEGIDAKSEVRFPMPEITVQDFSKLTDFIVQIYKYLTDKDYYLQKSDLGSYDAVYTFGPNYLQLPEYVGEPTIGKKSDILDIKASDILVTVLNTLKNPTLPKMVMLIPESIRFIEADFKLGPIEAAMAMGITTVEEFRENNPINLPANIITTLFQDQQEGILAMVGGDWNISPLISSTLMFGMSLKDLKGAGLYFYFDANLGANFIGLTISGTAILDLDKKQEPFIFDLQAGFAILKQDIATFITRIDSNGFFMRGDCTLLDWPGFKVSADLEGSLDTKGRFLLAGNSEIELAGIELLESSAEVTNTGILLKNRWLGFGLNFYSQISDNNLLLKGEAKLPSIEINKTIPAFSVSTPLGSFEMDALHVECSVKSKANMQVSKSGLDTGLQVNFHFIKDFSFTLSLPINLKDFAALKDYIIEEIIKRIKDSLLASLEESWQMLLALVKLGWAKVKDLAKALKEAFGKSVEFITNALKEFTDLSIEDIAAALKNIGATAKEIAQSLNRIMGLAGKQIANILKNIGVNAVEIAGALKDALNYSAEQMIENFKKIGATVKDIAAALGKVFGYTARQIAELLKNMGQTIAEIAKILSETLGMAVEMIADALQFIGAGLAAIAETLVNVLGCAAEQLARALDFIKASVADIAKCLSQALGIAAKQVAKTLKAIGKTAAEIAGALKDGLGAAADVVAGILDNIGFSPSDIAGALKNVFKLSGAAAAAMLKGLGKGAGAIAGALSNIYSFSAGQIAGALNTLKFSITDIAGALYNTLKIPPVRVADALKSIGAAAKEIADFFEGVNVPNIGSILDQIGFPDVDIKDALNMIGCLTDGWVCPDCCITDCCVFNCCITNCCIGNSW